MATPPERLAQSLEVLHTLQKRGMVAIRAGDLTRTHRERLFKGGFLQEVMKGVRQGQDSIRVNDQWRICFGWPGGSPGPVHVEIVDYH